MTRFQRFRYILRAGLSGLPEVPLRNWPGAIVTCVRFAWRMSGEIWVCVKPAVELRIEEAPNAPTGGRR